MNEEFFGDGLLARLNTAQLSFDELIKEIQEHVKHRRLEVRLVEKLYLDPDLEPK